MEEVIHYEPPVAPDDPRWIPNAKGRPCCRALGPEQLPFVCTRLREHDGPHAAHGALSMMFAQWPNTEQKN